MKTPITDAEVARAIDLYRQDLSLAEIGRRLHRSSTAIAKHLARRGVRKQPPGRYYDRTRPDIGSGCRDVVSGQRLMNFAFYGTASDWPRQFERPAHLCRVPVPRPDIGSGSADDGRRREDAR